MIKTGFSNVPQSIIDFEEESGVYGLSDKWKQGKISQEDLNKLYVSNAYWNRRSGSNVCFCNKDEAIATIERSKHSTEQNHFDVEIYNFKTGKLINYTVDYVVSIEE